MARWSRGIWVAKDGTHGIARAHGQKSARFSISPGASPELYRKTFRRGPLPQLLAARERDSSGSFFRRMVDARGRTVAQLGATRIGADKGIVILHSLSVGHKGTGLGNALGRIVSNEVSERWKSKYVAALVRPGNSATMRICENNGLRPIVGKTAEEKKLIRQVQSAAWQLYRGVLTPEELKGLKVMVKSV